MAVKTAPIRTTRAVNASSPVKTGNGKSIQRKVLPGLMAFPSSVQRKEQSGGWLHQQAQKPVGGRNLIQPKTKIHAANDHFEKEADHIADKAVSSEKITGSLPVTKVSAGAQRKCASCEKEEAATVQRKCSSCEEQEHIQKKTSSAETHTGSDTLRSTDNSPPAAAEHTNHSLDAALGSQHTRGSPLPSATREHMESRMGADFSNVRIHTDQGSHEASTSIGARAFTHGNNIHFAGGEFNPQSKGGQHLLAHELAHTMQQGASPQKKQVAQSPVQGLRKVVPKEKHEKKIARISSPHDNAESAQKDAHHSFTAKFKNKKAAHLSSSALKKEKGQHLNKDPVALPGHEEKKQEHPPKPVAKPLHLQHAKNYHRQITGLSSGGINFKPAEDKKAADNPVQKEQVSQSKKISENILSKAASAAETITAAIARLRPGISTAATKNIARIKANEAVQKEKIDASVKEEKAAAKKAMQNAAGSISGYHAKVTSELKAAATTARDDIGKATTKNTADINLAAAAQMPVIAKTYVDAQKDFEASGASVGNDCSSRQHSRAWTEFRSQMKHEDDSLLDGPYTDDMKEARADAAVKVGDGFKDGLVKAGVDQGVAIYKGMPADFQKITDARDEMLKHVNESHDASLKGVDAAEKAGISQADSTKKSMLNSVYTQHKAAQAKLDLTQKTQTQFTEIVSLKQCQQIELQAEQATTAMEEGGAQSLMHLHNGFKEYKQICESMNSPPPAMLREKLMPIEASLAQSTPAMTSTLQKGMMQTQTGFIKTTTETLTTTNTTVTQSLADAKADNEKAIDGLKKLQSSAITALQGILNNNKKTITTTASQCVTDIQNIKTAFDGVLTNIATDLQSGLKNGSAEFKKSLTDTVNNGAGETKSMQVTSETEEQKAADECSPRWKSVLKVLLVIAVVLVIALVVGPAVIGFIGAAAGGGAFGTAVGAVVGGAILGAASSGVIAVGNNLIDGKTWYKGVGEAMLEGAVTGAIGGAFGAAGSGLAGKLIGTAAKGVLPALGRFAIQQTVDFAGNIATEYVSSKIQGKEFSWGNVAQGQAVGAAMHIGMGGLSALKDVKGFKTINAITEGAGELGTKLGNKVAGKPAVPEPHIGAPHAAGEEPIKIGSPEEPMNKGPTAPKEEPVGSSKPAEETKTTEPAGVGAKEEPVAAPPPKEEHPGGAPKEEGSGSKAPAEEKKPSNLTQEEKDMGIVGKHPTEDGHNMKVTEDGQLVKCSTCELVEKKYAKDLEDPKNKALKDEFEDIKAMADPQAKAKAAAAFDEKFNKAMVEEYKARNPGTTLSDSEISSRIDQGKRINPDTDLLKNPETKGARKADIEAKHVTDAEGNVSKESFDTQAANTDEAARVKQAHEDRAQAQTDRNKLTKGTDEFNAKNKEMIDASEKMGEHAADAYMKEKYGVEPDYTGSGSRTVDKVYVGKDGKVYVVEAKGGSSGLGTKMGEGEFGGKVLEQGSKEYLEQTVKEMKASGDAKKIDAALKIEAAMESDNLVYLHASQKVGPNGELVPLTVKEFNLD